MIELALNVAAVIFLLFVGGVVLVLGFKFLVYCFEVFVEIPRIQKGWNKPIKDPKRAQAE